MKSEKAVKCYFFSVFPLADLNNIYEIRLQQLYSVKLSHTKVSLSNRHRVETIYT